MEATQTPTARPIFETLTHDGSAVAVTLEQPNIVHVLVVRDTQSRQVLLAVPAMHATEGILRTLLDAVDTDWILNELVREGHI